MFLGTGVDEKNGPPPRLVLFLFFRIRLVVLFRFLKDFIVYLHIFSKVYIFDLHQLVIFL